MDQVTQQNAALVEQAAAVADSMQEQAGALAKSVSSFRLDGAGHDLLSTSSAATRAVVPAPTTMRSATGRPSNALPAQASSVANAGAQTPAAGEWEAFWRIGITVLSRINRQCFLVLGIAEPHKQVDLMHSGPSGRAMRLATWWDRPNRPCRGAREPVDKSCARHDQRRPGVTSAGARQAASQRPALPGGVNAVPTDSV